MSSAQPITTRATMTMVLADPSVDLTAVPLAGVVELLGQTIRAELDDLTWVLHVVWDTGAPASAPPSTIPVPSGTPDVGVFVHDWLVQFCADWGIAFDQVVIESSGVNPNGSLNAALWWAMDGLDCTTSVNYLVSDPSQWFELPTTVGLVPATVNSQVVALLEPVPEAQLVRNLLVELVQIINAGDPVAELEQWWIDALATQRFRRWLRRWIEVVSQIYGSARFVPPAWPLEAVRVRFDGAPLAPLNDAGEASYGRWARAITDRRVGVALGGAGAQSYVVLPFIQKLIDAGVPIDILSGSSTGTIAAALYSALGERGLRRMLVNNNTLGWGVFFAFVSNIPLTWWLAWATEFVDLRELGQPVISAASVADTGDTLYQTAGLAGKGMMASGSMPPFVATYIGNTRLLDGGLTDDLPTAILQAAGAELVVAAQSIPKVMRIPSVPESIPIPYVSKWAIVYSPLTRLLDGYRGFLMLFRQAATGSEQYAQVTYNATTILSSAGTWFAGRRIALEAWLSPALQDAIVEAKQEWDRLLGDPGGRVRINLATGEVEIGPAVELGLELDPAGNWRLTPDAELVLAEVGRFVQTNAVSLSVTLVDVPPPAPVHYQPLFEAASALGSAQLLYSTAAPLGDAPTFSLKVNF